MESTYVICAERDHRLHSCKSNPITFKTDEDLALPNPDYLRIHAVCCRVTHLSGAAEQIDKDLEDIEYMRVLPEDGSSAHVLSFALQPFSQEVVVH